MTTTEPGSTWRGPYDTWPTDPPPVPAAPAAQQPTLPTQPGPSFAPFAPPNGGATWAPPPPANVPQQYPYAPAPVLAPTVQYAPPRPTRSARPSRLGPILAVCSLALVVILAVALVVVSQRSPATTVVTAADQSFSLTVPASWHVDAPLDAGDVKAEGEEDEWIVPHLDLSRSTLFDSLYLQAYRLSYTTDMVKTQQDGVADYCRYARCPDRGTPTTTTIDGRAALTQTITSDYEVEVIVTVTSGTGFVQLMASGVDDVDAEKLIKIIYTLDIH